MPVRALITGAAGQDGSYLAEWLLQQGYQVFGVVRSLAPERLWRLAHLEGKISLQEGNLLDGEALVRTLDAIRPHEIYNLAAEGFVPASWDDPVQTTEFAGLGVLRLLEAVRRVGREHIKFYQASSSEVFGRVEQSPQDETTPHRPTNPYGAAKALAHATVANYRERYGMFCVSGILFNHESPRRTEQFVPRKIAHAAAKIKRGLADELVLGNLDVLRDWGFAGDFVQAMWKMLQYSQPEDFVIGTGEAHSVRELATLAFSHLGLQAERYITVDPTLVRPMEKCQLVADPRKAAALLDWEPTVRFPELVRLLVDADVDRLK